MMTLHGVSRVKPEIVGELLEHSYLRKTEESTRVVCKYRQTELEYAPVLNCLQQMFLLATSLKKLLTNTLPNYEYT